MTSQSIDTSSIDSLLDGTLDDLADIPEFKPFPVGAHRVTIKWEVKAINTKPAIELTVTAIETLELTDPTATPLAKGDSTSVLFQFTKKDGSKNELAEGQFKELMRPLAAAFGTNSNRETMAASNGAEVSVITSQRKVTSKTDATDIKYYTAIDTLIVA